MEESKIRGIKNRLFQYLARILPGARSLRVKLHRARGVHIGKDVWIGYDVILDTSRPYLITIEDRASLSVRVTVIAHFRETQGVKIEEDAFVGPGAIILPERGYRSWRSRCRRECRDEVSAANDTRAGQSGGRNSKVWSSPHIPT